MTITHSLNLDEFANLVVDNLYEDSGGYRTSDNEGELYAIHSPAMMTNAFIWSVRSGIPVITEERYKVLKQSVESDGFTPIVIVDTEDGAYEFNLDILKLNFEPYSSGDKPDIMIAELPISKGKRILEWYPDFDSAEEYLDSLMGDAEPSQWDDGDEW